MSITMTTTENTAAQQSTQTPDEFAQRVTPNNQISTTPSVTVDQRQPNPSTGITLVGSDGLRPEFPANPGGLSYGGGSFLSLIVMAFKELSQSNYDTKIFARDAGFDFGMLKAGTLDGIASDTRKGAVAKFATQMVGAGVNVIVNSVSLSLPYLKKGSGSRGLKNDGAPEIGLSTSRLDSPGANGIAKGPIPGGAQSRVDNSINTNTQNPGIVAETASTRTQAPNSSDAPQAAQGGARRAANPNLRDRPYGNKPSATDAAEAGPDANDGEFVSPSMAATTQIAQGLNSMIVAPGEYLSTMYQADSKEREAEGQRYDTHAGIQQQYYSDASAAQQRANQTISSFIGQIYQTNTGIGFPR